MPDTHPDPDPQKDPELTKLLAGAKAEGEATAKMDEAPDFPGLQYLGCGYDIFGRYASPKAIKGCLFDFSKEKKVKRQFMSRALTPAQLGGAFSALPSELRINYSTPERVQYKPTFVTQIEYQSNGSLAKEQENFIANLGLKADIGAFAGELEARYEQAKNRLVTRQFYSATAIARYYDLTMDNFPSAEMHPEQLPVAEGFKKDLHDKDCPPELLFRNYGTHYLSAVTIGCRVVYSHTIDTSKLGSDFKAEAALKAKYEGVGGNAGATYIAAANNESDVEKLKWYSEGLDPDEIPGGDPGNDPAAKSRPPLHPLALLRSGWHNPVLIDLPKNALTPIWYLCTDAVRQKELEKGFVDYAKKHGLIVNATKPNIRALYLLCKTIKGQNQEDESLYRLSKTLSSRYWDKSKPVHRNACFYVFETREENTVPLYEHYYDKPGSDNYRYETESWGEYLKYFGDRWKKISDKPIGYVYDALTGVTKESEPVYAYFRKDTKHGNLGQFYSTDSSDAIDDGAWRAMVHPDDDVRDPNMQLGKFPDAVARVADLDGNIHWRTPTFAEG